MNNFFETVNSAIFNSVKEPTIIIAVVFALMTAITIGFVVHEIKKDKK